MVICEKLKTEFNKGITQNSIIYWFKFKWYKLQVCFKIQRKKLNNNILI